MRHTTIDYDDWNIDEQGVPLPQSTNKALIHGMVGLLNLKPGHKVLEIGTGTGYSTALLAQQTGASGRVTSVDVIPSLISRAERRMVNYGIGNVKLHVADGINGFKKEAQYDKIIAWATPKVIPHAWLKQATDTATILTPVKLAPVAAADAVLQCGVTSGVPHTGLLHHGVFGDMAADVGSTRDVPVHYVDAVTTGVGGGAVWLSAPSLRTSGSAAQDKVVADMCHGMRVGFEQIVPGSDAQIFQQYLASMVHNPVSIGYASSVGVGVIFDDGLAVCLDDGHLAAVGARRAEEVLLGLRDDWLAAGKPTVEDMVADFTETAAGWAIDPLVVPAPLLR